ncbi:hypothetical protein ACIQ9E_23350 [Streptomyces sp. NPDC094448]|uniref:hypothetical protein n=1 Tax=Streptomyces sp. NPDC094448 TaxID=3366063 RepID=UPI0038118315
MPEGDAAVPHGTPRTLIPLLAAVLLALPALGLPAASATPHPPGSGTITSAMEPGTELHGRAGEPTPGPGGPQDPGNRSRPGETEPRAVRAPGAARATGALPPSDRPAGHRGRQPRTPAGLQVFRC